MDSDPDTGIESPDGAANPIETDYEIGQDNITTQIGPFGLDIHNPVFLISGLVIVAFVFLTLMFQTSVGPIFNDLREWLTSRLDWFFIGAGEHFCFAVPFPDCLAAGQGASWRCRSRPRLFLFRLVCDAVCCRHGHWSDVLWRIRTDFPFHIVDGRDFDWRKRDAHGLGAA